MPNAKSLKHLSNDQMSQVYQRVVDKLVEKGAVSTKDHLYTVLMEMKSRNTGYDVFFKLLHTLSGNFGIAFPSPEELLAHGEFNFGDDLEELQAFFKSASRFMDHFMKKEKELQSEGFYVPAHSEPSVFGNKRPDQPSREWVEWRVKTAGGGVIAAHQVGRELMERLSYETDREVEMGPGLYPEPLDANGFPYLRYVIVIKHNMDCPFAIAHDHAIKIQSAIRK